MNSGTTELFKKVEINKKVYLHTFCTCWDVMGSIIGQGHLIIWMLKKAYCTFVCQIKEQRQSRWTRDRDTVKQIKTEQRKTHSGRREKGEKEEKPRGNFAPTA